MKKKVLFILSTNYAGSHFLSLILGSHAKAIHVGEIHRFQNARMRKEPCYLCGDFRKCPVFHGIEPGQIQGIHQTIFKNAGPDIGLIADNSKKTEWAAHFLGNTDFETRFVHLIRDPRALVRRWDIGYDTAGRRLHQRFDLVRKNPGRALSILTSSRRMLYVHKWVAQNQAITSFLTENHLNHRVVTYRDLAKNTAATIASLMTWLDLEFEPGQIEYWNYEHHGTQKSEYEWIKEKKGSYFDTRWKSYLSSREQKDVIDHPLVRKYLSNPKLHIGDEGLTSPSEDGEHTHPTEVAPMSCG